MISTKMDWSFRDGKLTAELDVQTTIDAMWEERGLLEDQIEKLRYQIAQLDGAIIRVQTLVTGPVTEPQAPATCAKEAS